MTYPLWQDLVTAALTGLEHTTLSPITLERLRTEGIDVSAEPVVALLEGAALLRPLLRAGLELEEFSNTLPKPAPDAPEKWCSQTTARHLEWMLGGNMNKILPEFFYQLQQTGQYLRPEVLPILYQACLRKKALWNRARPHIGTRGEWLLPQNPDWQPLLRRAVEPPPVFQYSTAMMDQEEEAYLCPPEELLGLCLLHQQATRVQRHWTNDHILRIIYFRIEMLQAMGVLEQEPDDFA
ncbi:MAG TPA: DUF5691 domain-containing protein [Saprospiraceae bacterium]|nr:DUF5691 domain-containing protein [Saprospiraceae bacterium]HMP24187.1 DUF5691 domain-containing protein [Saprospiraceae bacterium]